MSEIERAFRAGYHCRWHREQGAYCFDPAMSPGDPEGAYRAWLEHESIAEADPASPQALRELIAKWRKRANDIVNRPPSHDDFYDGQRQGQQAELRWCADELEAVLTARAEEES